MRKSGEKPALRRGGQAELRDMGLAEDDEAGLLEVHDQFGILIGNELAKSAGPLVMIVPPYYEPISLSR
jgi:hypothetical protein